MQLVTTHPIKKSDLGFHANLFGGKLLAWLDAAAAAYATAWNETHDEKVVDGFFGGFIHLIPSHSFHFCTF